MSGKESTLVVITGSPSEHISYRRCLALHLPKHDFRSDTFGRAFVMSASSCMYVRIAGVVAELFRTDPPLKVQSQGLRRLVRNNCDRAFLPEILGTSSVL